MAHLFCRHPDESRGPVDVLDPGFRRDDGVVNGVVSSIKPETAQVHSIQLEVPFTFKPGQSVQVHFPGEHKKRFYSISSSPTEGRFITITVKSEPGSILAKDITALKAGQTLPIDGPHGSSLALPESVQLPMTFIAAGTGVTPFRSMIRFLMDKSMPVDYLLLHSVKNQAELLFHEEFTAWASQQRRFRYVPTVTRHHDMTWKHETGRISAALIGRHRVVRDALYFLCGPSHFVADMEKALSQELQVPADNIRREKW